MPKIRQGIRFKFIHMSDCHTSPTPTVCSPHLESSSAPDPSATGRSRRPSAIANARNSHWAPSIGHLTPLPSTLLAWPLTRLASQPASGRSATVATGWSWPTPYTKAPAQVPLPSLPLLMSLVPLTRQWFVLFRGARRLTKIIIIIIKCSYIHFNTKNTSMSGSWHRAAPAASHWSIAVVMSILELQPSWGTRIPQYTIWAVALKSLICVRHPHGSRFWVVLVIKCA